MSRRWLSTALYATPALLLLVACTLPLFPDDHLGSPLGRAILTTLLTAAGLVIAALLFTDRSRRNRPPDDRPAARRTGSPRGPHLRLARVV